MIISRRGRIEEKKQQKRLIISLVGMTGVLVFLAVFGLKILVGFSLFVDTIRGASPTSTSQSQTIILPPTLDPLPVATNSSSLKISGTGQQGLTAILYINEVESKKMTVAKDGVFTTRISRLKDGQNTISAKLTDDKGNTSDLSNVLSVTIKTAPPALELNSPEDGVTVTGDKNTVSVSGKTEDEVAVTVNGRLVVIKSDNSFSYDYPLNDGENKLTIEATDQAGNSTKIERTVTYHK